MSKLDAFDFLFDPAKPGLTPEGLQRLVDLKFDDAEADTMDALAEKANEGLLSEQERREYEDWVRQGALISLLQAKARLYLKRRANAA